MVAAVILFGLHCGQSASERRSSIYELTAEPSEGNILKIRAMLDDADRDIRATALNALFGLKVADADELALDGLNDEDGFVRATAAKLLGDAGDRAYAPALVACLSEDPDPVARQRAAEALHVLGGPDAVEALARGLEDPMEKVRRASIQGLRDLDPGYARNTLLRLLRDDAVWEIRAQAARTLGLIEGPEIVSALKAALDDPNEFVRSAASNALRLRERTGTGGDAG